MELWVKHASVLRAIVENWPSDERLAGLWMEMMEGFTTAATYRIERDRATGRTPKGSFLPKGMEWQRRSADTLDQRSITPERDA